MKHSTVLSSLFVLSAPLLNHFLHVETSIPPLIPELLNAAADFPIPPPFDPTTAMVSDKDDKKVGTSGNSGGNKLGFGGSSGKVVPNWMKKAKSGSRFFFFYDFSFFSVQKCRLDILDLNDFKYACFTNLTSLS